ncbi:hypothetical protein FNV43_RR14831 [Rhamnella rubrinervis]|uniref:Uncharacterized protein n=1 Tax=Rhamnella rubrinervis TaxID=2594499 RepID=A0A8K0H428_9ROSA|nr:hypothetical protein FNV43_RR14831 [Rhamnella rubrinervis]
MNGLLIRSDDEKPRISQWVASMLENGEIGNIVDSRLRGGFNNASSAWKAVEITNAYVHLKSIDMPTMNQVAVELKECLALNTSPKMNHDHDTKNPTTANLSMDIELIPLAR